ncbi:MAG: AAA family ATPase, partial [Thermoflexales bacterium]|nr:AAA family ATPase [Thermoflexales bacterium]
MNEQQQLENAIAALEAQRAVLGDIAVEAALAGLRQQLAARQASPAASPPAATGKTTEGQQAAGKSERKLVTIVFADITGFTALAERLDAEPVRDLMNACFAQLVPLVEKYGGTVDKFVGDAVMALFGAPTTHENDAERACLAALEMMEALERFKAGRPELASLGLHIGINSGHVVAGDIGAGEQHAYSVIGDAVNLAARLEDHSQRGEILVGLDTYRLAAPLFEFESLSPVAVKGKAEPVVVYRLIKARAVAGQVRGIAGLDSPLVGREAEFQALQQAMLRLERGEGGVITLVGEAGLGKSRLVAELHKQMLAFGRDESAHLPNNSSQARANQLPLQWVEGRCLSYGESIAYLPWLDALRNLLGVRPDAAPAAVRDALRQHVQASCAQRYDEVFPYLAKLLSLPLEDETEAKLAGLGAQGLKLATSQAAAILLGCAAQARPLVLVCEDLHWADPTSLELLEKLLPLADLAPLLFIAVMRPEREHGCWRIRQAAAQREHHLDLQIAPLAPSESAALVSNLLRVQALPPALCQRILQSAEGNPFYVEEIIRSLLDSGAVVYEPALGRWRATREVDEIVIPDTLQGVLAARIDRLQGETKRILQL